MERDDAKRRERMDKIKAKRNARKEKYKELTSGEGQEAKRKKDAEKKKREGEIPEGDDGVAFDSRNDWRGIAEDHESKGCGCTVS